MKNMRICLLLIISVTLTACGHLIDSSNTDDSPPSASKATSPKPRIVVTPNKDTDKVQVPPQQQTEPLVPQPIIYDDLFDRLRAGFRLPDLQSSHVTDNEKWSTEHPTYLNNLFQRAEPFLFYIVEEVERRGLPMEIALLPAVESAFKPSAKSKSSASGLWQFIPSTAKYLGLRMDWWYDARNDLLTSTHTALDYLTELSKKYNGDWFLALAAYNAGHGTISKAIKRNKRKGRRKDFQSLDLRSETERYVPKLIALKNIINNPTKFNVRLPKIANRQYFVKLALAGQINLNEFADRSHIGVAKLQHLNAGYLRWATPPQKSHQLLVPIEKAELARSVLASTKFEPIIEYKSHHVVRGETVSHIAKQYGVTVRALKATNKLRNNLIRTGQTVLIPLHTKMTTKTPANNKQVHRVVRGDTLWSISKTYQVKLQQLLTWNNLKKNQTLNLNQLLTIRPY